MSITWQIIILLYLVLHNSIYRNHKHLVKFAGITLVKGKLDQRVNWHCLVVNVFCYAILHIDLILDIVRVDYKLTVV